MSRHIVKMADGIALERFERLPAMAEARAVRASATNATWNISFNEVEAERAIDLAGM